MQKLTPNFSFAFEGVVWNMMLDETGAFLILEIRHNQKHQVSFTAIELESGTVMWDGLEFEESWWVGMTAISKGVLLLHSYVDNADPEPKGMIAFDVFKQEVSWMHENFSYMKLAGELVVGLHAGEGEKYYETISLRSGERITVDENFVSHLKDDHQNAFVAQFPHHYKEDTPYFGTCRSFLDNRLGLKAVNAIEYLEVQPWIILSYYVRDEDLVNFLLIMDSQGEIFYHKPIQKNINAVGLETFFIVRNHLIFVKDKNEILCYNL